MRHPPGISNYDRRKSYEIGVPYSFRPALLPDLEPKVPGYQDCLAAVGRPRGSDATDIFIVPMADDVDGNLLSVDSAWFLNVTNKPGSWQFHSSCSPDGRRLAYFDNDDKSLLEITGFELYEYPRIGAIDELLPPVVVQRLLRRTNVDQIRADTMVITNAPKIPPPKSWNHHGLGNRIIDPNDDDGRVAGMIACHKRLGGLLRYDDRDAA